RAVAVRHGRVVTRRRAPRRAPAAAAPPRADLCPVCVTRMDPVVTLPLCDTDSWWTDEDYAAAERLLHREEAA
ncbi:MAG: hypothetical protein ACRCZP_04840, partial [Phycicoccus sp.]